MLAQQKLTIPPNRMHLSLGKALAMLKSDLSKVSGGGYQQEREAGLYLKHLHERYIWLTADSSRLVKLDESIPKQGCTSEVCLLENHEDFFVAYLMECFPPYATKEKNLCSRLIRHLNDCYPCFCAYANVMRDFYHETGKVGQV